MKKGINPVDFLKKKNNSNTINFFHKTAKALRD